MIMNIIINDSDGPGQAMVEDMKRGVKYDYKITTMVKAVDFNNHNHTNKAWNSDNNKECNRSLLPR